MTYWLRRLGYLLPCLAVASACERRGFQLSDDVPINGPGATSSFGGTFSTAGSNAGGTSPIDTCLLDSTVSAAPIFSGQTVSFQQPVRKELFALVSDAEAADLRAGAPLVPAPVANPPANALAGTLQALRTSGSEEARKLAETLTPRFRTIRSTWPNPWALRLVDHPGSQHMNTLRVVLRDDALVVRIVQGAPAVVDVNNASVALEVARAQPERIAAIYHQLDTPPSSGVSGDRCENGLREIALGSEAMVVEWSLGTREIAERLDDDIALLQSLFEVSRRCTGFERGSSFRSFTVCQTWPVFNPSSEYTAYQWSLATPVESYKPTPQNLASLIQALQDDRLEEDPFVVEPEPPSSTGGAGAGGEGAGGASQAGGAGNAGGDDAGAGGAL
jgi:hypothetical protein